MNMFNGVTRIIFDLDNTLIEHHFEEEYTNISKHFGMDGNEDFKKQLDDMFSKNTEYLKDKKVTKEYFVHVIEELMPILKEINVTGYELLDIIDKYHSGTLMDGAKDLLEYLYNAGYEIVALTNWFYDYQLKILSKLDISKYFERIYSWDDYYAKPNKIAMIRAIKGNTEPSQNVMIGDDPVGDIALAKKCGVRTIGFNVDYSKARRLKSADANVKRLIDIKKYL